MLQINSMFSSFISTIYPVAGTDSLDYLHQCKNLTESHTHFDVLKEFSQPVEHSSTVHPTGDAMHNRLINVYDNYESFNSIDPKVSGICEKSCLFVDKYKTPSAHCISSKEEFVERFDKLTQSILNFIDWNNVVVAGGLVNHAISTAPLTDLNSISSDIDIFMYGVNEMQAQKLMNQIYESLKDIVPTNKCVKTNKTITIILPMPYRHIQLVTKLFNSVGDILNEFDLGCSKVAFDGKNVWTTIDGHFSLVNNTNVYSPYNNNSAYESRLVKYSHRGYRVMVPFFDKNMVSNYTYKTSSLNSKSNSLVKLLHYDKFGKQYSNVTTTNRYYMDDVTYLRQNIDAYNSVMFTRDDNLKKTVDNIELCQQKILKSIRINPVKPAKSVKKSHVKGFKNHDIEKHPIYKVFDNIKLALIDRVDHDPSITGDLFINGSIFKKSTIYKSMNYKNSPEDIEQYWKIVNKSALNAEFDFSDIYYDKNVDNNVIDILSQKVCEITKDNIDRRDTLGRTYMQAAIMVNNHKLVEDLINNGYDLLQRLDEGMTSVHFAIRENRHKIVSLMLNKLQENGADSIKYYDNSGCNFSHYALMYSDLKMYTKVAEMLHVGLSEMSWSIRYNSANTSTKGRLSKYICCAKLCMMYRKLDILDYILNKYTGFNDFRYIFVDSDVTSIDTSDVLKFAVSTSNYDAIKIMCKFFTAHSIDICVNDDVVNALATTDTAHKDIVTILMLEKYTKRRNTLISKKLVNAITRLFYKGEYTRLLDYVNKFVPDLWTLSRYKNVHSSIKFDNIFGNKYVDTDIALRLLSAIDSDNFVAVDALLPNLQYGLYIYSATSGERNITPLTLCKNNAERLVNVLNRMPEKMSNKKNTYYKYIDDMVYVDHDILFDVDCLDVLLSHPVHGKCVIEHIYKYTNAIVTHIMKSSVVDGKYTYENFGKYLETLSKYDTIDFEKMTIDATYKELAVTKCVPRTLDELVNLGNVMRHVEGKCDPVLYRTYRVDTIPRTNYITLVKSVNDYNRLDAEYGALHNAQNLLCNSVGLLATNHELRNYLMDKYYVHCKCVPDKFNILDNWYGKTSVVFNDIVKKLNSLNLLESTLQNMDFTGKEKCILDIMVQYNIDQLLKDVNGNTVLHYIARNNTSLLFSERSSRSCKYAAIVRGIKFHDVPNVFGKTPMDYVKTSINDSSKYTEESLLNNIATLNMFNKKLQAQEQAHE